MWKRWSENVRWIYGTNRRGTNGEVPLSTVQSCCTLQRGFLTFNRSLAQMKTLDEMTGWRWCHTGNCIFLHTVLCKSHIPVLRRGSWVKCSQPAGPPMHWLAPFLGDAWPSSKTQDNQQYVHRHLWAGSHPRWRQTFPTNSRKQTWQEWRCCSNRFLFFWLFPSERKGTAKSTAQWHNCIKSRSIHSSSNIVMQHCQITQNKHTSSLLHTRWSSTSLMLPENHLANVIRRKSRGCKCNLRFCQQKSIQTWPLDGTNRRALSKLVCSHKLNVEVFGLWLPSCLDQPCQHLWGKWREQAAMCNSYWRKHQRDPGWFPPPTFTVIMYILQTKQTNKKSSNIVKYI